MSQIAEIVELRRIRPVKWSTIDKKLGAYRIGYVQVFLRYEGSPLLDEDGQPILSPTGKRQMEVTVRSFADRFGISKSTFQDWVQEIRGVTQPGKRRSADPSDPSCPITGHEEDHGHCSHCPEWEGEE